MCAFFLGVEYGAERPPPFTHHHLQRKKKMQNKFEAEAFRKVHPLEFHKRFLENKLRTDGRSLTNTRKTIITTGSLRNTTEGSSLVKMGNTSVVCGIKAEVAVPKGKQYSSEDEMRMRINEEQEEKEEEQGEGGDEGFYIVTVELPSI